MGIFRRGSKDLEARVEADVQAADSEAARSEAARADGDDAPATPASAPYARTGGPFDRAEVQDPEGRLDLGSLWLTGVPGMELRLEVEQETQNLVGVTAVLGESAIQLQAFAAPRTEGIWDEIRMEIAASITAQGGTAEDVDGPLGTELQARMPGQGPDGRTVFSPARFLGVDGPRWFLRGVLSGRAAVDPESAQPLVDVLKATVVVRGEEAMAPRDLLPLQLPEQSAQETPDGQGAASSDSSTEEEPTGPQRSADDLSPFERGPEITEIR